MRTFVGKMKLSKDIIIAIDGHASCGKSTLAKKIARYFGYTYIDTGAMYRAVAFYALEKRFVKNNVLDNQQLIASLDEINISFIYDAQQDKNITMLNGEDVESSIRSMRVSEYASPVATILEVRQKLVSIQQNMGLKKQITMDGRDIGTVVFPAADIKFFLTARASIRANRRFLELTNKGQNVDYSSIYNNIVMRDKIDSTRAASPLQQAEDAILIDNSNLSIAETVASAIAIIETRFGKK